MIDDDQNKHHHEHSNQEQQQGDKLKIYHQKQSKQLCALHALNNLFQEDVFTKSDLDTIANK